MGGTLGTKGEKDLWEAPLHPHICHLSCTKGLSLPLPGPGPSQSLNHQEAGGFHSFGAKYFQGVEPNHQPGPQQVQDRQRRKEYIITMEMA